MGLPCPEIDVLVGDVEKFCEFVPLTLEVHKEARRIAKRQTLRIQVLRYVHHRVRVT